MRLNAEQRAILGQALSAFIEALRPYLVTTLGRMPNSTWVRQYRAALPEPQRSLFDAEAEKTENPAELIDFGHLKSISQQHRPLLREDAGAKASNFPVWFEEINDVRTLWAHHRPLDWDDADHAFRCMERILGLLNLETAYKTLQSLRAAFHQSAISPLIPSPATAPTPKKPSIELILEALQTAWQEHTERFDASLVAVPNVFTVELHPEAQQALRPLFPRLQQHAKRQFSAYLDQLKQPPTRLGNFGKWLGLKGQTVQIESGGHCQVQFEAVKTPVALDFLAVSATFSGTSEAAVAATGALTKRYTVIRATAPDAETLQPTHLPPTQRIPAEKPRLLAQLQYGDIRFEMCEPEIWIGRADEEDTEYGWVQMRIPAGQAVSRAHCKIRYHEGAFQIWDQSRFGTTLEGQPLAPNEWHPLPRKAKLGLAGQVSISFQALH